MSPIAEDVVTSAVDRTRRLGRYYTPDDVAEALVGWALDGLDGPVLDPSYGGCSFLHAALRQMLESQNLYAPTLVFGVDVDPSAAYYARSLIEAGVPKTNLIAQDFFRLTPADFSKRFQCIVGNPPYIRHHWLEPEIVGLAVGAAEAQGCRLPRTANSWAHFLAASTQFLASEGRIAMLVPVSGLATDYAVPLLEFLGASFRETALVPIQDPLFQGTRERVAAVLASGWGGGPGTVRYRGAVSREAFSSSLLTRHHAFDKPDFVEDSWRLVRQVAAASGWTFLGDIAKIQIGTVTGANRFFIRRPSELNDHDLKSDFIVATSRKLAGLHWTAADRQTLENSDAACRLLNLPAKTSQADNSVVSGLISEGEDAGLDERSHCRKREPWWVIPDRMRPHAFLHYMTSRAPRVVLNEARSLCTNAVHRITWTSDVQPRAVAASSCTSLFELACELHGRAYSGGVLKLEPSASRLLPVAVSGRVPFGRLDHAVRAKDFDAARQMADEALLRSRGVSEEQVNLVRAAIASLRSRRCWS